MSKIVYPSIVYPSSTFSVTTSVVSALLDGAGDSLAFLVPHLDVGKTITSVSFWVSAVTGTPPAYTVRLEEVTAGTPPTPSGGLVASGAEGTVTPVSANSVVTATLSTPYAPENGKLFFIVVNSASASGANNATFRASVPTGGSYHLPCSLVNTTGSYVTNTLPPSLRITYSDGTYGKTSLAASISTLTVDSGTNPAEVGNRFIPRVPMTLCGISGTFRLQTTTSDVDLVVYNSSGTVLMTQSLEADKHVTDQTNYYRVAISNGADVLLNVGESYRVAFKPTTTGDTFIGDLRFASTTDRKIHLGQQDATTQLPWMDIYKTSRPAAGGWTDDEERLIAIWPLVKESSSGRFGVHPGMAGGIYA